MFSIMHNSGLRFFTAITILAMSSLARMTFANPAPGAVAVLDQPYLPVIARQPQVRPDQLVEMLSSAGISAERISASELADPEFFNQERFQVFVNLNGNAFPVEAAENLKQFHRAGGSFIGPGVMFCHPCKAESKRPKGWKSYYWNAWAETPVLGSEARTGKKCLEVTDLRNDQVECLSERISVKAGWRLHFSAYVCSERIRANTDSVQFRFLNGNQFVEARRFWLPERITEWTKIEFEENVPDNVDQVEIQLETRTPGACIKWDDLSLQGGDVAGNLLPNPGFEETSDIWIDTGDDVGYTLHAGKGLGTGYCVATAYGDQNLSVVENNPLELHSARLLDRSVEQPQYLDVKTLDPADKVEGIIAVNDREGKQLGYSAAVIRHECPDFKGAIDVWLGTHISGDAEAAAAVHAVAYCLREKGLRSQKDFELAARTVREMLPAPLPYDLPIHGKSESPRNFLPKASPPARQLVVTDVYDMTIEDKRLYKSLQGLVNRQEPRMFATDKVKGERRDERILDWIQAKGYTGQEQRENDLALLLRRFSDAYKGALIIDENLFMAPNIAAMIASCENLIVATAEQAERYELPVRFDMRGRFASNADGMAWVWEKYKPQLNHHLILAVHPGLSASWDGMFDYIIQHRGIVLWVTGNSMLVPPGSDSLKEMRVVERIFAETPPNVPVCGFWWHGGGSWEAGIRELPGVEFAGEYGKILVALGFWNMSVLSGIQIEELKQPPSRPTPVLDRSKIYAAYTISDGDAYTTFYFWFSKWFDAPELGDFPVGWGVGPTIIDTAPSLIASYYERAPAGDEFICDVSGVGYIYPMNYACRYRDRDAVWNEFLALTDSYMRRLGMTALRPMGMDRSMTDRFARQLPGLKNLMADYGRREGMTYDRANFRASSGIPVFSAMTPITGDKQVLLESIRKVACEAPRPAFINAFVNNWVNDMAGLKWVVDQLGDDFVFVTPSQLTDLYNQAYPAPE